ncbi:hypothetical protein HDU96_005158, partial [Phlyctochytrium bullatum]
RPKPDEIKILANTMNKILVMPKPTFGLPKIKPKSKPGRDGSQQPAASTSQASVTPAASNEPPQNAASKLCTAPPSLKNEPSVSPMPVSEPGTIAQKAGPSPDKTMAGITLNPIATAAPAADTSAVPDSAKVDASKRATSAPALNAKGCGASMPTPMASPTSETSEQRQSAAKPFLNVLNRVVKPNGLPKIKPKSKPDRDGNQQTAGSASQKSENPTSTSAMSLPEPETTTPSASTARPPAAAPILPGYPIGFRSAPRPPPTILGPGQE